MKQQIVDAMKQASAPAIGTATAWGLHDVSTISTIAVSIITAIYTIVLILKNLDEWKYRREQRKQQNADS